MTTHTRIAIVVAIAAAVAAQDACAETLYKLIDKKGKVTYVEKPPKDFDGQVIRLEIDPKANTATFPKPPPAKAAEAQKATPAKAPSMEDRLRTARAKVDAAKQALADAQANPRDGEIRFIGNVGGGTRPVPTPEYQARLEGLERDLREAEEELRRAEGR